jgi:hypothetical protein
LTNRRRLDRPPAHEDGIAYRHLGSNSFLIQSSDEHVSEQFVSHRVLSSWKKLSRQGTITSAPVEFSAPPCASTAISSRSQIGLGVFREVQGLIGAKVATRPSHLFAKTSADHCTAHHEQSCKPRQIRLKGSRDTGDHPRKAW